MKERVLDIVIPMAGRGSRFANVGYELPKPLIDVDGEPMIKRVIDNLRPQQAHRFIFLVLGDHLREFQLADQLRSWSGAETSIVSVDQVTEGAACTVLLARHELGNDHDMLIANSDQLVDIELSQYIDWSRSSEIEGSILVFEDTDPKWSFAKIDDKGFVQRVAEKQPISNLATVGIYYFSRGQDFVHYADQMINKDIRVNGEFYVCPVYNELIEAGGRVKTWKMKKSQMHGIGTPEDLRYYLERAS